MSPRVTIVIPTYNRFEYLLEAVESCIAQTEAVNIIVVDHGSSDATITVQAYFGDRILYIRREFDSGPHFSWLDGCLLAETDLVKLLFDDDTLEPTFIEKTAGLFSPAVGFVFSSATITNDAGDPIGELFKGILPGSGVFSRRKDRRAVRLPLVSPSAAIFRKEDLIDSLFIQKMPIQERTYHGVGPDHFVKLLALMRRREFGFVNEKLVNFRSHPGSITVASSNKNRSAELRLAYLDVANIAFVFQVISTLRIVAALRLIEPLRRSIRFSAKTLQRIRVQLAKHGPVPLRLKNNSKIFTRHSK
jgi:glycosyltransferase involved in cell wall biosynthesis